MEALENVVKLRPSWLAGRWRAFSNRNPSTPFWRGRFSHAELDWLAKHPDKWVRETAEAASHGLDDHIKS